MKETIDQVRAARMSVVDWMAQAHARWVACRDDQRDMFGSSEHDFWFGIWRACDQEGVRLLQQEINMRSNA